MPAKIFAAAKSRLIEIWDYTLKKWGEDQADAYIRGLGAAIHARDANRSLWRRVANKTGLWFVRHEHHDIFFRELSGGVVGIIPILHESMDLPARIKVLNFTQTEVVSNEGSPQKIPREIHGLPLRTPCGIPVAVLTPQ